MTSSENNLALWDKVCETDPKYTKEVKMRGGFTAIDAQYQLRCATAQWGPYGDRWGLHEFKWTVTELPDSNVNLALDAIFFYPGLAYSQASFPISVDMEFVSGNDCRKKLVTEARSKSLSCLGFNADIFLGRFDDSRYVGDMETKFGDQEAMRQRALVGIKMAKTKEALDKAMNRAEQLFADDIIDQMVFEDLNRAIAEREKQIGKPKTGKGEHLSDAEIDAQLEDQYEADQAGQT